MRERWKPVVGWEDRYEVSSFGRVRSLPLVVAGGNNVRRFPARIRATPLGDTGYPIVSLTRYYNGTVKKVHQLVLIAFRGPARAGQVTRHLDGDRTNPRLANLRWGTRSENVRDAVKHGTHNSMNRGAA